MTQGGPPARLAGSRQTPFPAVFFPPFLPPQPDPNQALFQLFTSFPCPPLPHKPNDNQSLIQLLTSFAVPHRHPMPPPQLPRDAPVFNVPHPVVVNFRPALRVKTHGTGGRSRPGCCVGRRARRSFLQFLSCEHRIQRDAGSG